MTPDIQSEISIHLDGQPVVTLPVELKELASAIEQSKYILNLGDNFDDMKSPGYDRETWLRATRFISGYAQWLFDVFNKKIETPKIYHAPEGGIDLYWENKRFNLLINIPAGHAPATFYGDDYGVQVTEGKFDPANFQQALLPDLSIIS